MARTSTLIRVALLAAAAVCLPAGAQPANNNCANAIPVPLGGSVNGSTVGATNDGTASCAGSGRDVWHSVVVPCPSDLTVYTCPASFNTVLSVRTGCPGGSFELACNDDSGFCGAAFPQASALTTRVNGGTYLIRVAGAGGATGTYTLHAFVTPVVPANDLCANALPIGNGALSGCTTGATVDGSADCGVSNGSPDVWYRYTAPCNGVLDVYTCPAFYDTVLSVHDGCPGTVSNQIACNDDSGYCGTAYPLASHVPVAVAAGQSYLIRVSGFNTDSGPFTLNTSLNAFPPANDSCANATPIGNETVVGSTSCATADGSASCGGSSLSPDVWYRYTAACNGALELSTCPASYDTVISVHSGCPGTTSNQLGCSDDSTHCGTSPLASYLAVPVVAGNSYLIRVSGVPGASGTFALNAACSTGQGACCLLDGSCVMSNRQACEAIPGYYRGDGTDCATPLCEVLFDAGRPCWVGGTGPYLGFSSGHIASAGFPQRWAAQAFTLARASRVSLINVDGFVPEGSEFTTINYIVWRRTGLARPTEVDQVVTGSRPFRAGTQDPRIPGPNDYLFPLPVDFELPAGDYYLTVYASVAINPGGDANFAWLTNAQRDPNHPGAPNTPIVVNDPQGVFIWRSQAMPTPGFERYTTSVFGPHPEPPYGPIPQDPAYLYNTSFMILGGAMSCYPNCDGSTAPPILNVNDFTCFLGAFAAGTSYANCDHSTTPPILNVNDFTCFLGAFAAGCP